jgi:peptidoglycan/LPS O-acetylase OafA/YrhL
LPLLTQTAQSSEISSSLDQLAGEHELALKLERNPSGRRTIRGLKDSSQRIPSLDGLRGLSIWAVMLAHASAHFTNTPLHMQRIHDALSTAAYFGVTTFFVISGFLITFLLLKEHTRTSRVDPGNFYRRRAVRILPAAFFYIAVVLLFAKISISQAIYAFSFTTTYFFDHAAMPLQQLWSLSVEEQFYLLWPLAFYFGTRSAKRSCWAVMFLSPVIRIILKDHGYTQYAHLAPAIGDSVAAGCLLAFYQNQVRVFVSKYLLSTPAFLALCTVTVISAGLVYRWDLVLCWGLVPCLLALVISAAIERRDRFFNSGVLVWTGLMSYSLYLWQQPFLVFDGPFNYFWARIVMTLVMGYLSYRFIEQPVLAAYSRRRAEPSLAGSSVIAEPTAAGL